MTQTSTVVHSINSAPQKSAGEPRKTAKNLAVPLALIAALATAVPTTECKPTGVPTAVPTTELKPTAVPTVEAKKPTAAPTEL